MLDKNYQSHIFNHIDNNKLPHSIIISGDRGCGKHSLLYYISDKFNLEIEDITSKLNSDNIIDLNLKLTKKIYCIEAKNISIKEQNAILKTLEEPIQNNYIIILIDNINLLLETIRNRCFILQFKPYPLTYLESLSECKDPRLFKLINTPGDLNKYKYLNTFELDKIIELSTKILTSIGRASIPNTLTILNKLDFEDSENNIDAYLLIKSLKVNIVDLLIKGELKFNNINEVLKLLNKLEIDLTNNRLNKQKLFENFLLELKNIYGY